jgi:hypothetical protein
MLDSEAADVVVSGRLVAGDGAAFASRTGTVGKAMVWLESEGWRRSRE